MTIDFTIVRGRETKQGDRWVKFNCHPNGDETPCQCPPKHNGQQASCGGNCDDTGCQCSCD